MRTRCKYDRKKRWRSSQLRTSSVQTVAAIVISLSTAVVGALMQCAKMMPAIVKFVLTACVGTLMHRAKMMSFLLKKVFHTATVVRKGRVSSDGLRQGSFHSSCDHIKALCDS